MGYDEALADRLRSLLEGERGVTEKRMFGGQAFLVHGNLAVCAASQGGLLARFDPEDADAVLTRPHVAPMVMRGRPMAGWIRVAEEGVATKRALAPWVKRSVAFVRTLPKK